MGVKQNLIGLIFNRLTITRLDHRDERRRAFWGCDCVCGNYTVAQGRDLKSGRIRSCGCLRDEFIATVNKTHGLSNKSSEYQAWKNLRSRCNNPNSPDYLSWGGRGIKVCDGWNSFENFLSDMGRKPSKHHSINRINNDMHYSCGKCNQCLKESWNANCQWDDPKTQANNRRNRSNRAIRPS